LSERRGVTVKRWVEKTADPVTLSRLAGELDLHAATAAVLIHRGVQNREQAARFLNPSAETLNDPFRLPDMNRAVERIGGAVARREPVVIYGDYDVDGITATSLFWEWFRLRGCPVGYYIPRRMTEGYGLNENAIRFLHGRGARLLITADCGTTSYSEISLARSLGLDVIVTDHHETAPGTSGEWDACAVVNPKRPGSDYPFDGLCTAGLVFKVIQALEGERRGDRANLDGFLDLVALGTLADVSPVTGENRYLVSRGLDEITLEKRPGIRALKSVTGITGRKVGCGTVGFTLAPRINAVGRLGDAAAGVRLLTTRSEEEAGRIATEMDRWNRERQEIEQQMVDEAEKMIQPVLSTGRPKALILGSRDWHVGVVGIGASRLAERYGCPAVLIAVDENGIGRGSARSVPGFDVQKGLAACADLLMKFGGHRQAAGLTVREDRIPALRERLSDIAAGSLGDGGFQPTIGIDAALEPENLSFPMIRELERLRPHGIGNPEPTFALKRATLMSPRVVGNNHFKIRIRKNTAVSFDAIGFRMGHLASTIRDGDRADVAFTPEIQTWQGEDRISLRIKDIRSDA
jgi:single-stranded-DNA-specific exonuclease